MAITFKYRGVSYTADTPQEAAETTARLKEQEAQSARKRGWSRFMSKYGSEAEQLMSRMDEELESPWTPEVFQSFIDRLGPPQQAALAVLVTRRHVTDEELRKALKVSGNQALAGVLSGISKQAAALGIPARAIFGFENLRNAGKRRSTYSVADKFLQIATDMNWPSPPGEERI